MTDGRSAQSCRDSVHSTCRLASKNYATTCGESAVHVQMPVQTGGDACGQVRAPCSASGLR